MTKLTEKEREGFERIMAQDLEAINAKFMNQVKDFWNTARKEVHRRRGFDVLMARKAELEEIKQHAIDEIHLIEKQLEAEPLRPEQIVELGGKSNDYGKYKGAEFYGIPIDGQVDYEIVEFIREHINLEIPSKFLLDLCKACMRELAMAGTFEEARDAYSKFYSMNFRKYGVDIPPRLGEMKRQMSLETTRDILALEKPEKVEVGALTKGSAPPLN